MLEESIFELRLIKQDTNTIYQGRNQKLSTESIGGWASTFCLNFSIK